MPKSHANLLPGRQPIVGTLLFKVLPLPDSREITAEKNDRKHDQIGYDRLRERVRAVLNASPSKTTSPIARLPIIPRRRNRALPAALTSSHCFRSIWEERNMPKSV